MSLDSCVPCDCNFPIAPVGEQGPQGNPGPAGPRGPTGPSGGAAGQIGVENIEALKAINTAPLGGYALIGTAGYWTAGDGGGALYYYIPGAVDIPDDALIILPDSGDGRFFLVFNDYFDVRWFGLKMDGLQASATLNNTKLNLAAQTLVVRGGGHLVIPDGTAYVDQPRIDIVGTSNIKLTVIGTISRPDEMAWNTVPNLFFFNQCNDVLVDGPGVLYGNVENQTTTVAPDYSKETALGFKDCNNVTVRDITIRNFGGFCINFSGANYPSVNGVRIFATAGNNAPVYGINNDGIHFLQSSNCTVSGCHIESTDDCIAFTQNIAVTTGDIAITGNVLKPYGGSTTGQQPSGIRISSEIGVNGIINNLAIAGNVIDLTAAFSGILVGGSSVTIAAGTYSISRCTITGNTIRGAHGYDLIAVGPQTGLQAGLNTVAAGITVCNCNETLIEGNNISECVSAGMWLRNSNEVHIKNNKIHDITWNGVLTTANAAVVIDMLVGDVVDVTIDGLEAYNIAGGGIIQLNGGGVNNYKNQRLTINDLRIYNFHTDTSTNSGASLAGVFCRWSDRVSIQGGSIENGHAYGVVIHPVIGGSYDLGSGLAIRNMTISGAVTSVVLAYCGTQLTSDPNVGSFSITDVTFGESNYQWVFLQNTDFVFSGNTIWSPNTSGTPQANIIFVRYGAGTSGTPVYMITANNIFVRQSNLFPTKWGELSLASGTPKYQVAANNIILDGTQLSNPRFIDTTATTIRIGRTGSFGEEIMLGHIKGANFNSTLDQSIDMWSSRYIITHIEVDNASVNMTTAAGGLYAGAGKTGTIIVDAAQVYTALTTTAKWIDATLALTPIAEVITATKIYFSLTTAQGAAATADIKVYGIVLA